MASRQGDKFVVIFDQKEVPFSPVNLSSCSAILAGMVKHSGGKLKIEENEKCFQHILDFADNPKRYTLPENMGIDEFVQLAVLVEKYQVLDLIKMIVDKLPKAFDSKQYSLMDVWKMYFEAQKCDALAKECEKILCRDTSHLSCLANFSDIKMDILSKFLGLDQLYVDSEETLISKVLKLVGKLDNQIEVMREHLLPKLRVLTLRPADLVDIFHFVTEKERLFLLSQLRDKFPLLTSDHLPEDHRLCLLKEKRKSDEFRMLNLFNDEQILDLHDLVREGKFTFIEPGENKFGLSFYTKETIALKDISIFTPLDLCRDDFTVKNTMFYLERKEYYHCYYDVSNLTLRIKTKHNGGAVSEFRDIPPNNNTRFRMNRWATFQTSLVVPKNSRVFLEVVVRGEHFMRYLRAQSAAIFENNDSETKEILETFTLEHSHKAKNSADFRRVGNGLAFTIFKGFRYQIAKLK